MTTTIQDDAEMASLQLCAGAAVIRARAKLAIKMNAGTTVGFSTEEAERLADTLEINARLIVKLAKCSTEALEVAREQDKTIRAIMFQTPMKKHSIISRLFHRIQSGAANGG